MNRGTYALRSKTNYEKNFALPDNPENSDEDGDSDSSDENDDKSESYDELDSGTESESCDESSEENKDWSNNTSYFEALNVNFEGDPRAMFTNENDQEIDYFFYIFTAEILNFIVSETNLYENKKFSTLPNTNVRTAKNYSQPWTDTCDKELQAWIGMNILMGIHQLPRIRDYWSTDPVLGVEAISNVMTRERFKKISASIHPNSNDTMLPRGDPNYDKLHKVRPIVENLNRTIKEHYQNSKTVAVDESMILFKGRSSLKQYNSMKPIKRGYKVCCLADSKTGYLLAFEIYTGKSDSSSSSGYTLGERVVINLTDHLKNTGILVAFDNFFTSMNLMKESRAKEIFAVKWIDSKPVTILSTVHNPNTVTFVSRKKKDGTKVSVSCPEAISAYNNYMGAVDRFDQFKERYGVGRRSKKWWHRIFYFLIDLAIVNSYLLCKIATGKKSLHQLDFRINLAKQLISTFSSRKKRGRPVHCSEETMKITKTIRTQDNEHMPVKEESRKRCKLCFLHGKETRTRIVCKTCKVSLCIDSCFEKFHSE